MKPDVLALTAGIVVVVAGLVRLNRAGPDADRFDRRATVGIIAAGAVVFVVGGILLLTRSLGVLLADI